MINIAFLFDSLECGGAEQALFDLLHLLDKSRFSATIFVINNGGIWEDKFRSAGFRVVSSYDCLAASKNLFVRARNFIRRKRIDYARSNKGKGLLDAALPGERFDIVVSYMMWRLLLAGFQKQAKSLCFFHWDVGSNTAFRQIAENNRDIMSKYDKIICVSKESCTSFDRILGLNPEFHNNPIDSHRICRMSQEPVVLPDTTYICAVGRLVQEKGFLRLVQIHKRLLEAGIDHRLVIVGEGPERKAIESEIINTGTEKTVIMTGYQSNPYPYIKNSRFVVCSSFTEALPVISMESLSLGIPVVSSAPSIAETFGQEMCGIITGSDDDSLYEGLKKMLIDETYYRQAKDGAQRRSAFFDGNRMVKEIEEIFTDVVK